MKQNPFIVINGQIFSTDTPLVMAIINITPDSFYQESRSCDAYTIIEHCTKAIEQGADILDIGAYSTRPNAEVVSLQEELRRMDFALNIIRTNFPEFPISIDTFRPEVAQMAATHFAANIINDISAGALDEGMFDMVAQLNIPYILMHSKGNPQNMQQQTHYKNFIPDLLFFFSDKIEQLRQLGFTSDIIIDPGFGFAKTTQQNFELLNHLDQFHIFNAPILVGVSRKSMIWKTLNSTPQEALNGTSVIHTIALEKGAHILRVHDVKQAKECITLVKATQNSSFNNN